MNASARRRFLPPWSLAMCAAAVAAMALWVAPPFAAAQDEKPAEKKDDLTSRVMQNLFKTDKPAEADDDAEESEPAAPAAGQKPIEGEKPAANAPAEVAPPAASAPAPSGAPRTPWPEKRPVNPAAPGGAIAPPAPAPTPTPAPAPTPRPAAPPAPGETEYTIAAGDTFTSIAVKLYGDEKQWAAIAQANPLVDPVRLKVGQKIRLPDLARAEQERDAQLREVAREIAAPGAAEQTVTVQPGDTLSHIAQRVYGKASLWRHLFDANKDTLDDPGDIKVGQKLKVPPKPAEAPAPPAATAS